MKQSRVLSSHSAISINFVRLVWPDFMLIFDLGIFHSLLKKEINASFASPSVGAAVSFILSTPLAISPTMEFIEERGMTFIFRSFVFLRFYNLFLQPLNHFFILQYRLHGSAHFGFVELLDIFFVVAVH